MERKLLYKRGNIFTGYPYGVEAELPFGSIEVHGPFSSENEANTYAHRLVQDENHKPLPDVPYVSVKVVRIELPQVGRQIVRQDGRFKYAQ